MKRFTGFAGNKKMEDAESESDMDITDSEDEFAFTQHIKGSRIDEIAEVLFRELQIENLKG